MQFSPTMPSYARPNIGIVRSEQLLNGLLHFCKKTKMTKEFGRNKFYKEFGRSDGGKTSTDHFSFTSISTRTLHYSSLPIGPSQNFVSSILQPIYLRILCQCVLSLSY